MEALSKIRETERTLRLLEDETRQLKENLIEEESEFSEDVETLETRNEEVLVLIKDLEAQVESLNNEIERLKEVEALVPSLTKASEDELSTVKSLEEQVIAKVQENSLLKNEVDSLLGKISKLEEMVNTMKADNVEDENEKRLHERIFELEKQLEDSTKLREMEDMLNEVSELNKKLQVSENEALAKIEMLTTQTNGLREKLSIVEKQNEELTSKVEGDGNQKARIVQAVERKVDEMSGEFKNSFEANIRIMRQRIRVAEQFQTENKETCRKIKEKCEREHSGLDKRVQAYSRMIATSKGRITKFFNSTDGTLAGLEMSFSRFGEKEADFSRRISKMADEIIVMKNRFKEKEEIRRLEEKINKEKGEHWRLKRKLNELQKRVDVLEKAAVEKEEAIFELVDEKKDAIRQLCNTVEYHQNRCDQLAKLISNSTMSNKDRRRA